MTISIGLGRVGSNFSLVVGWVGSVSWWVGLCWVTQNGPMDNSELNWPATSWLRSTTRSIRFRTLGPWLQKMASVRLNSVPGLTDGRRSGHHCGKYWKVTAYTDFNEDTTNESASVACSKVRLWMLHGLLERMKKHVLMLLGWKDWERFWGFRGQQMKQMSWFLTKLK